LQEEKLKKKMEHLF